MEQTKAAAPVAIKAVGRVAEFSRFLDTFKPQIALALPKHMNADRMTRLALTAFSTSPELQLCLPRTIAASLMVASQMGLEPGVNGQGYLIPYKAVCTFVPGWKGLVDIVNRSGRASVWTGAVFEGDEFDYALGDDPFITHRPGEENDPSLLTHVYAVGRVNGSNWPVIEVWSINKIWNHRNQFNKMGGKHYSFRNPEMYARKIPLLQVLKYMPSSVELATALAVTHAAEEGHGGQIIDGDFVTLYEEGPSDDAGIDAENVATFTPRARSDSAKASPAAAKPVQPEEKAKPAEPIQKAQAAVEKVAPAEQAELVESSATFSQLRWVKSKIEALELTEIELQALLERTAVTRIDVLTTTQYNALRADLMEQGA